VGGSALAVALNDGNTAVGLSAGAGITTGQYNTAIGLVSATGLVFTGDFNSSIGYNASPSAASSSGQFTLGDVNITNLRCNDTSISALSDSRDKTDVINSPYGLDFINTVRPVQFKWETRDGNAKDGSTRIGFLAQELLEATDGNNAVLDLVLDDNPEKLEAKYGNLLPIAIKAIQELSTQLNAALARIEALEGK
jgi:trimeric autotransporter adhesin